MNEQLCTFGEDRDEAIVAYLYGESAPGERRAFDQHLSSCALCRHDLDEIGLVRSHLAGWEPPAVSQLVARQTVPTPEPRMKWWKPSPASWHVPVWAQTMAAAFLAAVSLGVAAGVANLEVRYDQQGLSMRTGWARAGVVAPAAPVAPVAAAGAHAAAQPAGTPWRADLTALEQRLRSDLTKAPVVAGAVADHRNVSVDAALLEQVRSLIDESQRQNRRELALRVAEVVRTTEAQRQADLVKIDRSLGMMQNSSAAESMRQRQILNNLAVRVSQKE